MEYFYFKKMYGNGLANSLSFMESVGKRLARHAPFNPAHEIRLMTHNSPKLSLETEMRDVQNVHRAPAQRIETTLHKKICQSSATS